MGSDDRMDDGISGMIFMFTHESDENMGTMMKKIDIRLFDDRKEEITNGEGMT